MPRKSAKQALADAGALLQYLPDQPAGTMEDRPEWYEGFDEAIGDISSIFNAGDIEGAERALRRTQREYNAGPRPPRRDRPRCGATTRKGAPCKAAAYWVAGEPAPRNGRCRIHGGLSTGPVTPEGKQAIRESNRRRAHQAER